MKAHLTAGLIALACLTSTAAHAEIRFGVSNEAYPPFYTKDASGKWAGWEIDLLHALCDEMKEKCTIVDMTWDGLIPGLKANKIDVIWSSMSINDERKKVIAFTDKYYNTPTEIVGLKDAPQKVTKDDLKDKIIGTYVSSIQSAYFKKHYSDIATEKNYPTLDESLQDLVAGRVDYVIADSIPLAAFLESSTGKECCESKGQVPDDAEILGTGIGGGLRQSDTALVEKLNKAIAAVRANGKYKAISAKYFSFDPYGN